MRTRVALFAVMTALPLSTASTAAADPVTVTTGNINFSRQNMAGFSFSTADGSFFGGDLEHDQSETFNPPFFCSPCEGNTYNLSVHVSTTGPNTEGPDFVFGTVSRGGQLYGLTALSFDLRAGDIIAPGTGTVTSRFTFSGMASGVAEHGSTVTLDLVGRGRVSSIYGATDGWLGTTYVFASEPVPEPASLMLLASGAIGVCVRRRTQ